MYFTTLMTEIGRVDIAFDLAGCLLMEKWFSFWTQKLLWFTLMYMVKKKIDHEVAIMLQRMCNHQKEEANIGYYVISIDVTDEEQKLI